MSQSVMFRISVEWKKYPADMSIRTRVHEQGCPCT